MQGAGEGVHDTWDNRLVESLRHALGKDYDVRYPRMPDEADPTYAAWAPALERELAALSDDAMLVAHSVGGTILLKLLSMQSPPRTFRGIFLIAPPFVGEGGWPAEEFRFPDDLGAHLPAGTPIHFFHGTADVDVPPSHVEPYTRMVPRAHIHRQPGRDHQLNDDLTEVADAIRSIDSTAREE